MYSFNKKLYISQLCDLTKESNKAYLNIQTTTYKIHENAELSGLNNISPNTPNPIPLFNTNYYLDDKNKVNYITELGLPNFRMKRGKEYTLIFNNYTGYSFNIHWHGLNTTGDVDGASCLNQFGINTKIGGTIEINFPNITNNSGLLWVHAHPMFNSSDYVYSGIVGSLEITDDISNIVNDLFDYGNNLIPIIYKCIDLNENGTINNANLYTDGWRGTFGLINGYSSINWTNEDNKYVSGQYHESTKNIVKVTILNSTNSFRVIYAGVCDKNNNKKNFWFVMLDDGFRNPIHIDILSIAPSNRVAILIDLNEFEDGEAYLFFYNFDLTEVLNMTVDSNNNLIADIPDTKNSINPSPSPTPIPGNETLISYPITEAVPYINESIPNGNQSLPSIYTIKKYLKIKNVGGHSNNMNMNDIIENIRNIVFGNNYNDPLIKKIVNDRDFEYNYANIYNKNYISLLNSNYYYNLPIIDNTAERGFAFFPESSFNYIGPDNKVVPYFNNDNDNNLLYNSCADPSSYSFNYVAIGSTEVAMGASRIIVDQWNSREINKNEAMKKYFDSYYYNKYFSYKPDKLPTPLFKIFPTGYDSEKFVNYNMISNDTFKIDIFDKSVEITGIDTSSMPPLFSKIVQFDEIDTPINIQKWTEFVNKKLSSVEVILDHCCCNPCNCGSNCCCKSNYLSDLLEYDWTYYPYALAGYNLQTNPSPQNQFLNSVMIRFINKSKYKIRISGKWELLNFFGKPLGAMSGMSGSMMPNPPLIPCSLPTSTTMDNMDSMNGMNSMNDMNSMNSMQSMPYNFDAYVMNMATVYPDPNNRYDVNNSSSGTLLTAMDQQCYFVISEYDKNNKDRENNGVYKGFVDGFMNDAYQNFSVKLNSSERWTYYNWDGQDTHPFHFHLTSGFIDYTNSKNNISLNPKYYYNNIAYSVDSYPVGSQQNISWYLNFSNYPSNKGYMYNGKLVNIGFMYHCHYLTHHDMNMMGQYYVYENDFEDN
jgi:FtsP/CotA-like multicopper oxidase with cupredoxin domain